MTNLKTLTLSASRMDAQTTRLRVIAENLRTKTRPARPGAEPYRRKTITFESTLANPTGTDTVDVKRIGQDQSDLPLRYDPSNPAANAQG